MARPAHEMCDRRTGIGADGVIVVSRGDGADDVGAEVVNSDGSPGGMCGNGIRMVAKLAIDRGYVRTDRMTVEMGGRRVGVEAERGTHGIVRRARADMGEPVLEAARVPVDTAALERLGERLWIVHSGGDAHEMTFVSMGNPHAVMFVDEMPGGGGDPGGFDSGAARCIPAADECALGAGGGAADRGGRDLGARCRDDDGVRDGRVRGVRGGRGSGAGGAACGGAHGGGRAGCALG